jgi:hypothetical protein
MAGYEQYIPPGLRGPLRDIFGMARVTGEGAAGLLGAVQQDPLAVNQAIGEGMIGGIRSMATDPVGTVRGVVSDTAGTVQRALTNTAADYLPEGVTLATATLDQIKTANDARYADLASTAAMAIPGTKALRAGARAAGSALGQRSLGNQAASAYMIGQKLEDVPGYKGATGKPSKVKMPSGESYDARPVSQIEEAAKSYMKSQNMDVSGFAEYPPFSEQRARLIAAAYDMMEHNPTGPAVKRAYDAMIEETMGQYRALKDAGVEFKFLKEGMEDPYAASPAMGYQDIVENGKLWVFPTDFGFGTSTSFDAAENPLLKSVGKVGDKSDAVANDAFRAVHDAFGHFGSGNPFFRRQGEERAFLEHSRMYSPDAIGAMTSETRGQNSWLNSGPFGMSNRTANTSDTVFADQKSGLMPSWTSEPAGMPDPDETRSLLRYIENQKWQK